MDETVTIARAGTFEIIGKVADGEGKELMLLTRENRPYVWAVGYGFLGLIALESWYHMRDLPAFRLKPEALRHAEHLVAIAPPGTPNT